MSTTDVQVQQELQWHMLEPPQAGGGTQQDGTTWLSGLWTFQEILDYANQRQYRFMKDTLLMMAYARVTVPIGEQVHALPSDWIVTYDAAWKDGTSGTITELPRSGTWEIDATNKNWQNNQATRPLLYSDAELAATLQFQTMPICANAGEVHLLYVSLTSILTGAGEIFTVPDEFIPAVKYGMLADMLRKVGRAQDTDRADYCEARYNEGVEAAKMMLGGWIGGEDLGE